ncbi:SusC/RagA family TonB-linked outer membrane protein [Mucilaginibacter lacusdianchii]|uniref:SusC/RagA family TonB-linked outer membrane protein n=1 Tax=Mucilaginibacter lacusdianchii TaxID=2684211 RepID=UPI00131D151F|nr:SusC/RagA family TonB-linked outer membrane protein [Mucilaginibacter sp. JXJ CY 39]
MKLIAVFLLTSLVNVYGKTYSQIVSLHEKNANVKTILSEIEKQTGYHFLYDKKDVSKAGLITVNLEQVSLEKALEICFRNQPLNFKVFQQTIVLKKAEVSVNHSAVAAPIQVQGTVTDSQGQPLPGVSVKVKGFTTGTVTDVAGRYSISVEATGTLVFSFVGFTTQEVSVISRTQINIKLAENSQALSDVVVVGYGSQSRKEVTSAVAHVDSADFRQSGARSPIDLVQGKVAGLTVTRAGGSNPNSAVSIQLRGAVTVTGSTTPLFVIDGIPGGNLDLLQQDDIASIDVLKDGSGAAIYGTTANNGVILITTKKGKKGTPQFDYSNYVRKEFLIRRLDFLTADEYRQRIASGDIKQKDFGSSTDFLGDLVNKDNISHNHNFALSGGTDKSTYRASLNYRDLQGIGKENARKEYTLRLNMTQKGLNDKLNVAVDLATNFNRANLLGGGGWESERTKNPTLSNFNPDGSYRFDLTSTNEYARLFQETNIRKQQTTSGSVKADLEIVKNLTATAFGSVVRNSYVDSRYAMKQSEASREYTSIVNGGYAYKGDYLSQEYAFEPTLQYKNTFMQKHSVTALAGYSYRYGIFENSYAENRGFINDQFHEDNLSQGSALTLGRAGMGSGKNDNTLVALFGRINYAFDDKYLLQGIVRREGSSRFGDNNKFGYFPSVSAGWVLSQESFIKKYDFIDYLKLRVGYGVTGNSGFENNASRVTLGGGGRYLFPDGTYLETYGPDRNPNPNLRWETKREANLGLDFTLLKNRLSGSIDVYKRTTKDLLDRYEAPVPAFVRNFLYTNVGTISSKGIELQLSYAAIQGRDFKWNIDATASTFSNKLDSYSNNEYTIKLITSSPIGGAGALGDAVAVFEGGALGEFWGKRFAGFTPDGKWLFYNRNGEAVPNASINSNLNDRSTTDLAKLGNAIPKYYASLTNSFAYKNFDLRTFLRGKFGFKILNTTALSYANRTWSGNLLESTFSKYNQINDTYQYSDYYLENGSFLKLDEITLGYTFKFKTKMIRNLRVYLTGQNLITITSYTGNDPDFVSDISAARTNDNSPLSLGVDNRSSYPSTRSVLVGLNVGF